MKLYRIKDWVKLYEVSDSKKVDGPLSWVAVRTKQDGFGFRRLAAQRNNCEMFAAFVLMVEIAARQRRPERGCLMREGRPLTANSLAIMTGFPEAAFERALVFFCDPEQGWMEQEELPDMPASPAAPSAKAYGAPGGTASPAASSATIRIYPDTSGVGGSTGQDRTGHREPAALSSSPPASDTGRPAEEDLPFEPITPARAATEPARHPANAPVPFLEIVGLYNTLCPSFPRAQVTESRKKAMRARWLEQVKTADPMTWFKLLFAKAEASDFLSGRKSAPNSAWRCGLDWLLSPTNAAKVIEGNYDKNNHAGSSSSRGFEHGGGYAGIKEKL